MQWLSNIFLRKEAHSDTQTDSKTQFSFLFKVVEMKSNDKLGGWDTYMRHGGSEWESLQVWLKILDFASLNCIVLRIVFCYREEEWKDKIFLKQVLLFFS